MTYMYDVSRHSVNGSLKLYYILRIQPGSETGSFLTLTRANMVGADAQRWTPIVRFCEYVRRRTTEIVWRSGPLPS